MADFSVDEIMQCVVDDYTASRRASLVGRDEEFWVVRHLLTFDLEGLRQAELAAQQYERTLLAIETQSSKRQAEEGSEELPISAAIIYFKLPKSPT